MLRVQPSRWDTKAQASSTGSTNAFSESLRCAMYKHCGRPCDHRPGHPEWISSVAHIRLLLADAADSKSADLGSWGFDSPSRHQLKTQKIRAHWASSLPFVSLRQ